MGPGSSRLPEVTVYLHYIQSNGISRMQVMKIPLPKNREPKVNCHFYGIIIMQANLAIPPLHNGTSNR